MKFFELSSLNLPDNLLLLLQREDPFLLLFNEFILIGGGGDGGVPLAEQLLCLVHMLEN